MCLLFVGNWAAVPCSRNNLPGTMCFNSKLLSSRYYFLLFILSVSSKQSRGYIMEYLKGAIINFCSVFVHFPLVSSTVFWSFPFSMRSFHVHNSHMPNKLCAASLLQFVISNYCNITTFMKEVRGTRLKNLKWTD